MINEKKKMFHLSCFSLWCWCLRTCWGIGSPRKFANVLRCPIKISFRVFASCPRPQLWSCYHYCIQTFCKLSTVVWVVVSFRLVSPGAALKFGSLLGSCLLQGPRKWDTAVKDNCVLKTASSTLASRTFRVKWYFMCTRWYATLIVVTEIALIDRNRGLLVCAKFIGERC